MSDYIKREDAIKGLEQWKETQIDDITDEVWNRGIEACINEVKHHIPSADVVEVIHGYWEQDDEFVCSVCGYKMVVGGGAYNYCPNCGARMDGEEE